MHKAQPALIDHRRHGPSTANASAPSNRLLESLSRTSWDSGIFHLSRTRRRIWRMDVGDYSVPELISSGSLRTYVSSRSPTTDPRALEPVLSLRKRRSGFPHMVLRNVRRQSISAFIRRSWLRSVRSHALRCSAAIAKSDRLLGGQGTAPLPWRVSWDEGVGGPDRPPFFTLVHFDHASGPRIRPLISTTRVQSFAPARAHGLNVQNRTDLPDTLRW